MTSALSDTGYRYQQVIARIRTLRETGALKPGERLPSLRQLAHQLAVSVPTIQQGYAELERLGWVEARPQSGYYLKALPVSTARPRRDTLPSAPVPVRQQRLIEMVHQATTDPSLVPLGISNPAASLNPSRPLELLTRRALAHLGSQMMSYGPATGYEPLRQALGGRYHRQGIPCPPETILITNGAQEALTIALKCVARPGDVIAVESPTYFGLIELIESLGMMAFEIPACPDDGVWLADLKQALDTQPIRACMFASSINNPLGSCMSDTTRRALVAMLEARDIPLIEDDVYGDLHFGATRATPAQAWSTKGLVLTCSSFSKTAASGYRVGWLLPGRFWGEARRLKSAFSGASPVLHQWVMAEWLRSGQHDRTLARLRPILAANKERMVAAIQRHFPAGTRHSDPGGGCVIWLELASHVSTTLLFEDAIRAGVSMAPGPIFSASGRYHHCLRLSFGLPWTPAVEAAVATLGRLAEQSPSHPNHT